MTKEAAKTVANTTFIGLVFKRAATFDATAGKLSNGLPNRE
jgi:hypothetical protein